jgi:hypothetical protein
MTLCYCRHRLQVVEEAGQVLLKVLQQLGEAVWTSYATTLSFRPCDRLSRPTRRSFSPCFRYSMFNIEVLRLWGLALYGLCCGWRVLQRMERAVALGSCIVWSLLWIQVFSFSGVCCSPVCQSGHDTFVDCARQVVSFQRTSFLSICPMQPSKCYQQTTGVTSQSYVAGTGKTEPRASANDQLEPGRVSAHDQ